MRFPTHELSLSSRTVCDKPLGPARCAKHALSFSLRASIFWAAVASVAKAGASWPVRGQSWAVEVDQGVVASESEITRQRGACVAWSRVDALNTPMQTSSKMSCWTPCKTFLRLSVVYL